jgi:hypothetical protein
MVTCLSTVTVSVLVQPAATMMVSPVVAALIAAWRVAKPPLPTSRMLAVPAPSIFSTPLRRSVPAAPAFTCQPAWLPTVTGSASATAVMSPVVTALE